MSIICLKGFWNLSWSCQEGILTVSGRPLDGAWKLFGRFGKGVWKVSETEGVFELLKSFCHWVFFSEFFTQFSFDSKLSSNQFFYHGRVPVRKWMNASMQIWYASMQLYNFAKKNYPSFLSWVCNYATIHTILWSAQKKGLKRKENSSVALLSPTCCGQAQPQLQMGWVGFILSQSNHPHPGKFISQLYCN